MRTQLLWVLTAFILASCSEDEGIAEGDITEYHFYQEATLTNGYPYVVDGASLVFERYFERDDVPEIADDEYSDLFFFEVVPQGNSFLLEGPALLNAPTMFHVACFCAPSDVFEITNGSISGEEIGGVWRVSVNIEYSRGIRDPQTGEVTEIDSDVLIFEGLFLTKDKPAN